MPRTKISNGEVIELSDVEEEVIIALKTAWDAAANDRALAELRLERNARLAETDFYALSDVTMTDAMSAYRTSLRNLPANTSNAVTFIAQWHAYDRGDEGSSAPWPTKP